MSTGEKPRTMSAFEEHPTDLRRAIDHHIVSYLGNDSRPPRKDTFFQGLAYSVRERLIQKWIQAQRSFYEQGIKRVYYLSLEFLPGRFLLNYILNLGLDEECRQAMAGEDISFSMEEIEEEEWDAGLGNGGLGRLASCFMDSMATLRIPAHGYGIHYDYGIFFQDIVNGYQVERADNWHRHGSPWGIYRRGFMYEVKFNGRSEAYADAEGRKRYRWVDTENIMAMACDILIPGFAHDHVNNMRLWVAVSSREFNLTDFNLGDYIGSMHSKVMSENISKVLYPRDDVPQNRELRLKQQYFFVSATFQDIMRRFKKRGAKLRDLPKAVAVQLNDTHPAIGVPELMRLLMDDEGLGWEEAWDICYQTFAYTNHTVLPEAMETWSVELLGRMLPRHLEIIYEINRRFLGQVQSRNPGDLELLKRVSILSEGSPKEVRMAHLAIVGSHTVNGVADLHSRILKDQIFPEFNKIYPGKFINITNGITPRRWLMQANPKLSQLIRSAIGTGWQHDFQELKKLVPLADDPEFCRQWGEVRALNKERLTRYIDRKVGFQVNPSSMFDVQVKRIHEYKRQLLNVLHVIALYQRLVRDPSAAVVPRTVIFSGKAAPGYTMAKLIIKLIHAVADVVNSDPACQDRLSVVFLPNYCVSQAEKLVPAADLSEQISTAGMEASGTGNMKFALNGSLIIGTLDGANIEIREEVGEENIFIFGLRAEEVAALRKGGYNPSRFYVQDPILAQVLDAIRAGSFSPEDPNLFAPIIEELLHKGDRYMVLADFRDYLRAQEEAAQLFLDPHRWARSSILNTANMGKFSSDRAIGEYAEKIWKVKPLEAR
jgi:starch phosphorylase